MHACVFRAQCREWRDQVLRAWVQMKMACSAHSQQQGGRGWRGACISSSMCPSPPLAHMHSLLLPRQEQNPHEHTSTWLAWVQLCLLLQDISHKLAPGSLFCLSKDNPVRKCCIKTVLWKPFDWLMLGVIIANCVTLAMDSSRPGWEDSATGKSLKLANYVFIAIFTSEAVLKIIALGLVMAPNTYLRDGE